jgi:hypothetical protein
VEFASINRMYGHAALLKQHAELPSWLPFPYAVQHGWFGGRPPTPKAVEVISGLARVWAWTRELGEQYTALGVPNVVGGAPFIYAQAQTTQTQPGRGTLAFPLHGTARIKVSGNFAGYIDALQALPAQFQPVSFCLHPGDLGGPLHRALQRKNLAAFTNGSPSQKNYLHQLIRNLRTHAYVTSNGMCTALIYAAYMQVPSFLYGPSFEHENLSDPHTPKGIVAIETAPSVARLAPLFAFDYVADTHQKRDAAAEELGALHALSPAALRALVLQGYPQLNVLRLATATAKRARIAVQHRLIAR